MKFRILGPLEVVDDAGRTVRLSGTRQRALLAALVLRANQVVSSDELLEEVWGDDPPASGIRLVQVYVSQLRKALGEGAIATHPAGYVLTAAPNAVDLQRFEHLLGKASGADPEAATAILREALDLWRGPPLADFAYESFAQVEIARLQELRLTALEARIEADLELGRHRELVGELEALVAENPLRQQLHGHLMVALYRCGRQPEALSVYRELSRALREELGLEPARPLRELEQAILTEDTSLDLPAPPAPAEQPTLPETASSTDQRRPHRDVRKTVTAVRVSLTVSSKAGAKLDPEALRRVTSRAIAAVEAAVERHGGSVDSVGTEGVTAVFGMPTVHEDDALRAARAAVETHRELAALRDDLAVVQDLELEFRIGMSSGEVVSGDGSSTQLRATGEPLTRSLRLAESARRAETLFDDTAWRLLRDVVVAERADGAWRLVGVPATATASARRLDSPMVGRDRERRRMLDAFEQAAGDRSCQLFTVLGLAGVGKSRLVHEFLRDVAGRARVARGRCLPYGQGITYWPLLEAIKEIVGLEDDDPPDLARAKLLSAIGDDAAADGLARGVAEMIGLAEGATGAEEGVVAVREVFERLAETEPLVVVFDDIHWAEPTFLDVVEHVAEWVRDAPVLLVCLARPELLEQRPGWGGGKLNATTTLLEPLSDRDCAQLVENVIGRSAGEVGARIVEAAEGNPLFVEEMLLMLIDDGVLVRQHGGWEVAGDLGAVRVPPTIQSLLAARLDQLDVRERAVIERASVAGKVFQEGAVVELSPAADQADVSDALSALVRKELIRPDRASLGEPTYRFRHLLIRDAAYDSIPKEARAGLHERFGHWLDRTAGERAPEYEEVVGYHLEQAYRYWKELGPVDDQARVLAREAAERLGRAGQRAFVRSDAPAGLNLISRAAALLPPEDPKRVELVPNVRVVQGMTGDLGWADKVLTEAVEAAATSGDRRLAATALVQRGFLRLFTEASVTADELIDVAERAIEVFAELDDELGLARAWRLTAQAHYLGRRAAACADASERAFEHARRAGDIFEQREILEWLVIALFLGPTPASEAMDRCRQLLRETGGDPVLEVHILGALAFLGAMQSREEEARDLIARGHRAMRDLGDWIWIYSWHFAAICLWQGDPDAAEQELRPAYEALKTLGEKSHFSTIAQALSSAAYMQGRYDEAERLTHECEEATRANDVNSEIVWRSTRAQVLARRGELEAADRLVRDAVALAFDSDFHLARADALMALGEVQRLAGDAESAREALAEAIRFYELKGNVVAARHARDVLAELEG